MADNVTAEKVLNPLGPTFATEEYSDVHYPVGINGGIQSTGNTTTTALGSNETFTGAAEQNSFPDVMCSCYSDVVGTLYFDFSVDGTNWRTFPTGGFVVAAGIHEFHTAVKGPRYFRARFVNGSSAQSTLQLYTYYGQYRAPSAPLNQSVGVDADALVVRPTITQDEISTGRRGGVTPFNKFAHRPVLDTADGSALVIADSNTNQPTLLTSPETFTITYTQASDGSTAQGARNLYFYYIDSDGKQAVTAHTLGSDGSDVTSFSGYGINRVAVGSSGTTGTNGADITITHTTNTGVAAFIPAGAGVTQQAILFTPIDARAVAKNLLINITKLSGGGTPRCTIKGWVWNRPIATKFEIFRYVMDTSVENHLAFYEDVNFPLTSGDVLWFEVSTTVNATVVGSFRFSANIYTNA